MTFTAAQIAKGHSPESRRKAVATMRRNGTGIFAPRKKKAKGKGGTTHVIPIALLGKRPYKRSIARKGKHILRTPLVKAQLLAKYQAHVAAGMRKKDAADKVGVHATQLREWAKDRSLKAALNGYTHHAANGSAVRIVLQLNGEDHTVSLQEAINLRMGLDAVLGARTTATD
jgi:hypothetical protein